MPKFYAQFDLHLTLKLEVECERQENAGEICEAAFNPSKESVEGLAMLFIDDRVSVKGWATPQVSDNLVTVVARIQSGEDFIDELAAKARRKK